MFKLRWLFFVLVLLNLVIFLWPVSNNVASHVYSPKSELNPHFVRLNKEIEERFYTQVDQYASMEELSDSDGNRANIDHEVVPADSSSVCYRVGPFMQTESYELAQAVLFNAKIAFAQSRRPSQKSDVYRLFLGPFASRDEVVAKRIELKQQGVLDHFVRRESDSVYLISLGIYSSEAAASAALELFEGKLEGVKKKNETVVLPDSRFLHFVLPKDSPLREQLGTIEWGESSVRMGPFACQS